MLSHHLKDLHQVALNKCALCELKPQYICLSVSSPKRFVKILIFLKIKQLLLKKRMMHFFKQYHFVPLFSLLLFFFNLLGLQSIYNLINQGFGLISYIQYYIKKI